MAAEAKAAFSVGKKLKKAKFFLERDSDAWSGMFDADNFAFGSVKLPESEEMTPDNRLEERIEFLDTFSKALRAYYVTFVEAMRSSN